MSKISDAISSYHELNASPSGGSVSVSAVSMLLTAVAYLVVLMSFSIYDLTGVVSMAVFPIIIDVYYDIHILRAWKKLWPIIIPIVMIGIANPILDHSLMVIGSVTVYGGVVSFITLIIKGVLSVSVTYTLARIIGIEGICSAMRRLHLPEILVTTVMLICRYFIVLIKEIQNMMNAYSLRAPGQKGINIRLWGSFAGLLLLRTIKISTDVYGSMLLRGYGSGVIYDFSEKHSVKNSILFAVVWCIVFLLLRFLHVSTIGTLLSF